MINLHNKRLSAALPSLGQGTDYTTVSLFHSTVAWYYIKILKCSRQIKTLIIAITMCLYTLWKTQTWVLPHSQISHTGKPSTPLLKPAANVSVANCLWLENTMGSNKLFCMKIGVWVRWRTLPSSMKFQPASILDLAKRDDRQTEVVWLIDV